VRYSLNFRVLFEYTSVSKSQRSVPLCLTILSTWAGLCAEAHMLMSGKCIFISWLPNIPFWHDTQQAAVLFWAIYTPKQRLPQLPAVRSKWRFGQVPCVYLSKLTHSVSNCSGQQQVQWTGYGLEDVEIGVRRLAGAMKYFSFTGSIAGSAKLFSSPQHPDRPWSPHSLLSIEYCGALYLR
jgi:hypothetical protein